MIDSIIAYCIRQKLTVFVLVIALVAWGSYSLFQLPIDAVPDITDNQVQIITHAPSLAALEVEQYITSPIELAIQNTPDMMELRSISRSGMSVITAVFDERIDVYRARQLLLERIGIIGDALPPGSGTPELAPISTGLGEIYQYTLRADKSVAHRYSAQDLRALQDWVVKRQLAGIKGVAEVNSFGGFLKQYEVSVNPEQLLAWNVSLDELFSALQNNNQNAGGAYIEKGPRAYFIRTEGLYKSIDEISQTVIRSHPVVISVDDVAEVRIGGATRFGAVTRNGEGEVVGGIVMMLKGSNSSQVVSEVKNQLEKIQSSLPEGVILEAFLDREKLVNRTISTVTTNLVEGGLIVVGILVLLLGNIRAGFIVASVIPLAMLFAFGMMNLFGVSANLMSLGAIDFGLIVDGSIIVIESIIHRLNGNFQGKTLTKSQMNAEVKSAATYIRRSAAFGELIILIVYIPILTLRGIEGKMFIPMAQTVSFAIFGALILSMTYVPAAAALFLKRTIVVRTTLSDKIMAFLFRSYSPVLEWALKNRTLVVGLSLISLAGSGLLFSRLGGEFIPTLEEGDLALHQVLPPGSSLQQSIASSTDIQNILLEHFPEVEQVVTKIGTAEIPTDLMPMELADVMVILKPKSEWTSATTRAELIEKMDERLAELTGLDFEYTQPIQMRFNELMTGVRQDIAIKIYGDDLNQLATIAEKAEGIISGIEGANDIRVEVVEGLPQLVVRPNRERLLQHGITINDINKTISTMYAGHVVGSVYEGERRFDLVVRLHPSLKDSISYLKNMLIRGESGQSQQLGYLAEVGFEGSPVQISRDNTQRRIVIGVNSRDRDVASLVAEIHATLQQELPLPDTYYITYGGQFENLEAAKARLSLAVPAALLLIVFLLYMTFNSMRDTMLVITSIPFAAIGGVLALTLRGMAFSISAGVGFIALFGVAVLNGIVLMAYFRDLESEGVSDVFERVRKGTRLRLRPVTLTAAVASLGFLPMALSSSAGAEVQQPLATVVIGGLITSTLLTLVVLPVILTLVDQWKPRVMKSAAPLLMIFMVMGGGTDSQAQTLPFSSFLDSVKTNFLPYKMTDLRIDAQKALEKTAWDVNKPQLSFQTEERKGNQGVNTLGFYQQFDALSSYKKSEDLMKSKTQLTEHEEHIRKMQLLQQASDWYFESVYLSELKDFWSDFDSLFTYISKTARIYHEQGSLSVIELARTKQKIAQLESNRQSDYLDFQKSIARGYYYLHHPPSDWPTLETVMDDNLDATLTSPPADILRLESEIEVSRQTQNVALRKKRPGVIAFGGLQTIDGNSGFVNAQIGITLPLWNSATKGRVESAKAQEKMLELEKSYTLQFTEVQRIELIQRHKNILSIISFMKGSENGFMSAKKAIQLEIEQGALDPIQAVTLLSEAYDYHKNYLQLWLQLHKTTIEWNILNNQFGVTQ